MYFVTMTLNDPADREVDLSIIARVCHEANKAWCEAHGDFSQQPWDTAPEWQRESCTVGVRFHADLHDAGITPGPSASHEKWLDHKRQEGWKYGPTKCVEKKEHPCFLPFEMLPLEQQLKDALFGNIVKALYLPEKYTQETGPNTDGAATS